MKRVKRIQFLLIGFLAVLLIVKSFTKVAIHHDTAEYAALIITPVPSLHSVVVESDLPKGAFRLAALKNEEGFRTLREAAYLQICVNGFWIMFGAIAVSAVGVALFRHVKTNIAR